MTDADASKLHILTKTNFPDEGALDNPVWSCLTTRHARYARGPAHALRYVPEFSPLSGMAGATAENVAALLAEVDVGDDVILSGAEGIELPPNWEVLRRNRLVQMVRRERAPLAVDDGGITILADADVDAMLALVELTQPGPFRRRTNELGHFVGIREGGQLLAMAGERMWIGNYRQISGVCTHPDAQRRGLAHRLMGHVINRMLRSGQTPFLHVRSNNEGAIATYERLGFVRRTEIPLVQGKRIR